MNKKLIAGVITAVVVVASVVIVNGCKKDKYIAEFSYSVNGEIFTIKGGGVSYTEFFDGDSLKTVYCYTMDAADPKNNGKRIEMEQYYNFFLVDTIGGKKSHFDMQNTREVNLFCLDYKGKEYYALSGFVDLKKENTKKVENMEIKGKFEAVMVSPRFHPTDTIIVKNGSFYYSQISYGGGRHD